MFLRLLALLLGPMFGVVLGCPAPVDPGPGPTPSPSASPTLSPSASATESPSASATALPSASATASPSASPTASPSASPSAEPSTPAPADAWPYPKACVETEFRALDAWIDTDENTVTVARLLGASRPCAGATTATKGVRLALTQYHLIDGEVVAWMGTPWRTNSIGDLKFRRAGTAPGELTALCISTGIRVQPDGVYAEHNRCLRPVWDETGGTDTYEIQLVPTDDPSVSVPLQRVPPVGESAPASCRNCLVEHPSAPLPTPEAYEPATREPPCIELDIVKAIVDADRRAELTGSVRSCAPGETDHLALTTARYGVHGGRLGIWWGIEEADVHEFVRSGPMRDDEDALCVISGWRPTDDGTYAHHEACLAIERNAHGELVLVPVPVNDPRVMKPVDTTDDGDPGGSCATCL